MSTAQKLEPVMVYCPFSKTTINIAPLLHWIHVNYIDFDGAAADLNELVEDFILNGNVMDENPQQFRNHMFTVIMLRHCFLNMKNGEEVQ